MTIQADLYIKELEALSSMDGTEFFPVQTSTGELESSTYYATGDVFLEWLKNSLRKRIRTITDKTAAWTVVSTDSANIFNVSISGSSVTCTISPSLTVGFEFEIINTDKKQIVIQPNGTEKVETLALGGTYTIPAGVFEAGTKLIVRKETDTTWRILFPRPISQDHIVLKSPDNSLFKVTITNGGVLETNEIV